MWIPAGEKFPARVLHGRSIVNLNHDAHVFAEERQIDEIQILARELPLSLRCSESESDNLRILERDPRTAHVGPTEATDPSEWHPRPLALRGRHCSVEPKDAGRHRRLSWQNQSRYHRNRGSLAASELGAAICNRFPTELAPKRGSLASSHIFYWGGRMRTRRPRNPPGEAVKR